MAIRGAGYHSGTGFRFPVKGLGCTTWTLCALPIAEILLAIKGLPRPASGSQPVLLPALSLVCVSVCLNVCLSVGLAVCVCVFISLSLSLSL